MSLPSRWIDEIFTRLFGSYGTQFSNKFSRIEDGVDVGLMQAKKTWAEDLAGFVEHPEAIAYALKNLPSDFPPNSMQFADICRRAPHKELPALKHTPTAEEIEHQRVMAKRLGDVIGVGKFKDGIDTHWATHPRSAAHLAFIFDAANRDQRFKPCIEQMIEDGICTTEGKLLKTYRAGAFV